MINFKGFSGKKDDFLVGSSTSHSSMNNMNGNFPPSTSKSSDNSSKERSDQSAEIRIGKGAKISDNTMKCDALHVAGEVTMDANLKRFVVEDGGIVNGKITTDTAVVNGTFDGTLDVSQDLKVGRTAHLKGAARYGSISVDEGAEISAEIKKKESSTINKQSEVKNTINETKKILEEA